MKDLFNDSCIQFDFINNIIKEKYQKSINEKTAINSKIKFKPK